MATIKSSKGRKRIPAPKKTSKTKVKIIFRDKENGSESSGSGGFHKLYCYMLRGNYYWTLTTDPEDNVNPYFIADSGGIIRAQGSTNDILGRHGSRVEEYDIEF